MCCKKDRKVVKKKKNIYIHQQHINEEWKGSRKK